MPGSILLYLLNRSKSLIEPHMYLCENKKYGAKLTMFIKQFQTNKNVCYCGNKNAFQEMTAKLSQATL